MTNWSSSTDESPVNRDYIAQPKLLSEKVMTK